METGSTTTASATIFISLSYDSNSLSVEFTNRSLGFVCICSTFTRREGITHRFHTRPRHPQLICSGCVSLYFLQALVAANRSDHVSGTASLGKTPTCGFPQVVGGCPFWQTGLAANFAEPIRETGRAEWRPNSRREECQGVRWEWHRELLEVLDALECLNMRPFFPV